MVQLEEHFPRAAETLANTLPDILAFTAFPVSHWQKLWSNNPQGRLNKEIRQRRTCPHRVRGGHLPQSRRDPPSGGHGAGGTTR
ncbi:MAG: transposase [Dehalococcoidia bacterium]|nr:transposase [Dehalococcoidia bacterium]